MNRQLDPAESGFRLEKVYFPEQSHRLLNPTDDMPNDPEFQFGWDWKLTDNNSFEVMLHLTLGVCKARPEETKVFVCGVFALIGEPPNLTLTEFVRVQGPAILLPYAREAISSLTGRSFFGANYLPPLNVMTLTADLDVNATEGAKQLKERERSDTGS